MTTKSKTRRGSRIFNLPVREFDAQYNTRPRGQAAPRSTLRDPRRVSL